MTGPWIKFSDKGKTVAILPAGRLGEICRFERGADNEDNANLIIAAPRMLEAPKEISGGKGPYSLDNYQFAVNTIEAMKEIAIVAMRYVHQDKNSSR